MLGCLAIRLQDEQPLRSRIFSIDERIDRILGICEALVAERDQPR